MTQSLYMFKRGYVAISFAFAYLDRDEYQAHDDGRHDHEFGEPSYRGHVAVADSGKGHDHEPERVEEVKLFLASPVLDAFQIVYGADTEKKNSTKHTLFVIYF